MKKMLVLVVSVAMLTACGSEYYRKQSTMELCMDYMTLPSANVNQGTRARVLAERGADCSQYVGAASARNSANVTTLQNLQQIQRNSAPPTTNSKTYIINGRQTNCITTGNVTNCN